MEIEMTDYPRPPFASQAQSVPGSQKKMDPYPDCGEKSYTGSGRLANKIALITGADSGIGRAVAIAFAREGADVALAYLDEHEDAKETARWVEEAGRQCLLLPGDLAQKATCQAIVDQTVEQFGRIDVLVNNAAFQMTHETLEDIPDEEWVKTFDINITAMFRLCKAALPQYEGRRVDHQYQFGEFRHAQAHVAGVCRHQGRDCQLYRWPGAIAGQQGHPGEQRSAWADLDAADCLDHAG
jgi:NAD(P)-dependent dehydrogenase (short-subunit alcohol dehydrogenase family)